MSFDYKELDRKYALIGIVIPELMAYRLRLCLHVNDNWLVLQKGGGDEGRPSFCFCERHTTNGSFLLLAFNVMSEPGSSAPAGGDLDRLMAVVETSSRALEAKFEKLRSDVIEGQEQVTERLAKRIKRDRPYVFKKKGNEKQHEFNEQLEEHLQDATDALAEEDDRPALKKAKEALKKGAEALAYRQKLIRFADRSELGWAAVEEYEADELADVATMKRRYIEPN